MRILGWLLLAVGALVGFGGVAAGDLSTAGLGLLIAILGAVVRQRAA